MIVPPVPTPATKASRLAVGVAQDLLRRRAAVHLRVGRVVELLRHEVVLVLRHQLLGGEDGAGHALDRRREDELGAVALQQLAALGAHVVRHRQDQLVALHGSDHREADAGVAGRRLDDGGAGLEHAALLGVLDHRERDAVLDAAAGVAALELGDDLGAALGHDAVEPHHRRVADEVENAGGDAATCLCLS